MLSQGVLAEGRITTDQVLLYTFDEGSGGIIHDVSGVGTPSNLVADQTKTSWQSCGGLSINQSTFIGAQTQPTKLIYAVQASNEISIEAWIRPDNITQSGAWGPSRIVTYTSHWFGRNFTLGQQADNYNVLLRTSNTQWDGGYPFLQTTGGVSTNLTHLVYSRNADGQAHLYLDGVLIKSETIPGTLLDGWVEEDIIYDPAMNEIPVPMLFGLGDDPDYENKEWFGNVSWLGAYHLVALYSRALSPTEVAQNYSAGLEDPCANAAPVIASLPIASVNEGELYSYTVTATDPDNDVLSYALTDGPAGLSMSASGQIQWSTGYSSAGSYPISIIVSDPAGLTATQNYNLVVHNTNRPPVIQTTALTTGSENTPYAYTVGATDLDGDALTYALTNKPAGMAINSATGLITWLPDYNAAGSHTVLVTVTDALGASALQDYLLVISNVNQVPVAENKAISVNEDGGVGIILNGTDADGDPLSYMVVSPPAHGALTGTAPNLTYQPSSNVNGVDHFTFKANDGVANSNTAKVTIMVTAVNDAPQITSIPVVSGAEGSPYTYQMIASDVEGDALTYSLVSGPVGMALDSAGLLTWTPDFTTAGSYTIDLAVADGLANVSQQYSLVVNNANLSPVVESTAITTGSENTPYSYDVNATDADGDVLTFVLTSSPSGMVIDNATGLITWQPDYSAAGSHPIQITVTDPQGASVSQDFVLVVGNTNQAPVLTSFPAATTILSKHYYGFTVRATDPDGDGVYYYLESGPVGLSIHYYHGTISWNPTDTQLGEHTVTIRASDEKGKSTSKSFILTVTENSAPVFTAFPAATTILSEHYYGFTVTATDPDGDEVRYYLESGPVGLSIHDYHGTISWVPKDTQLGEHTVTLRVSDEKGKNTSKSFILTVTENSAPVFTSSPALSITSGYLYSYQVTASDPDGDTYTVTVASGPVGLLADQWGTIRWTPDNSHAGANPVSVLAIDSKGKSNTQNFIINVIENQAPIFTSQPIEQAGIGYDYLYQVQTHDPENETVSLTLLAGPAGLTLADNGLISWPSNSIDALGFGVYAVSIEAKDSHNNARTQNFDISVITNAAPTITTTPPTAVNQFQTYFYDVDAVDSDENNLIYTLNDDFSPVDATINPFTGTILWTPSADHKTGSTTQDLTCLGATSYDSPWLKVTEWKVFKSIGEHADTASWTFNTSGDIATQTGNAAPSLLVSPIVLSNGAMEISLKPIAGDDDYIGFVWGFQDTEHFYRFRWGANPSLSGIDVTKIATPEPRYEGNHPTDEILYSKTNLPWSLGTEYRAILEVTSGFATIQVYEGNTLLHVISIEDDTYLQGQFGFYTHSQSGEFRARPLSSVALPDLMAGVVTIAADDDSRAVAAVHNRGLSSLPAGTVAELWGINEQNIESKLATTVLESIESGGQTLGEFSGLDFPNKKFRDLRLVLDPSNQIHECHEDNNSSLHALFNTVVEDPLGLTDSQRFAVSVLNQNAAPVIVSDPVLFAAIGNKSYRYRVEAEDADLGDSLRYELLDGPQGMQFIANKAQLIWEPDASMLGQQVPVSLRVTDLAGASAEQSFIITVHSAPVISSLPPLNANQDVLYSYNVVATDADGDLLTYELEMAPTGMSINSNSGAITWTPTLGQASAEYHTVAVRVMDPRGAKATQIFLIGVLMTGQTRQAPFFTSTPVTSFGTDPMLQSYRYDADANDLDRNARLTYRLIEHPAGMHIDEKTGLIVWIPAASQLPGEYPVTIEVNDHLGGIALQSYSITAVTDINNKRPQLLSVAPPRASIGQLYQYQAQVYDPETDLISYRLENEPAGMTVSPSGLIEWTPADTQVGTYTITLVFSDGNAAIQQLFSVTVTLLNLAPEIISQPNYKGVVGYEYQYQVIAVDIDNDPLSYGLQNAPSGMSIDDSGLVTWTPTSAQIGQHPVTVNVADQFGGVATQNYLVNVLAHVARDLFLINEPKTVAFVGTNYRYRTSGFSERGGAVTISLVNAPSGMTLSPNTPYPGYYELNWLPDEANCQRDVTLELRDSFGNATQVTYTIDVYNAPKRLNRFQCSVDSEFCATR